MNEFMEIAFKKFMSYSKINICFVIRRNSNNGLGYPMHLMQLMNSYFNIQPPIKKKLYYKVKQNNIPLLFNLQ
jgi:hypothetical protein